MFLVVPLWTAMFWFQRWPMTMILTHKGIHNLNPARASFRSYTFCSSYERGLIDKLCTSGGIARAPPASEVKRFITLARNLNVGTIASILLEKCSDPVWQVWDLNWSFLYSRWPLLEVRLKSLFVMLALLDAPGCAAYTAYFQQHASTLLEVIQFLHNREFSLTTALWWYIQLKHDKKALIVAKAFRIFALLGVSSKDTDHSLSTAPKSSVEPQLIDLELPPQKMSSPVGLIWLEYISQALDQSNTNTGCIWNTQAWYKCRWWSSLLSSL